MPSEKSSANAASPTEAYVWVFLPGAVKPVVAGRVYRESADRGRLYFNYGRSYLARSDAIPLYLPELPLQAGAIAPLSGLMPMAGCLRDASPDAWGRRVLIARKLGNASLRAGAELDELTYLLESGTNRTGALDFQASPTGYQPRQTDGATLAELMSAAEHVESGVPLSEELANALQQGTALGGARPKAIIHDETQNLGGRQYIAKFSSSTDITNVVKAEYVAMRLADCAGLNVAQVRLERSMGKDVLLVERFDRARETVGWSRRAIVSALTILGLDEIEAAYASYEDLATHVRHRFTAPKPTLHEIFGRLVFNILCGNTDDHARNHAAFWDGRQLTLTPAYDICPQLRTGQEASQAMLIRGTERQSQLSCVISAASLFLLDRNEAIGMINAQISSIERAWDAVCDEAALSPGDRSLLWGRQFFNPYAFYGAPDGLKTPTH
jgi:serine/threonine-protein kinase HipA